MEDKLPIPPEANATSDDLPVDPAATPEAPAEAQAKPDDTAADATDAVKASDKTDASDDDDAPEEDLPTVIPSKGALIAGNILALIVLLWVMWTPFVNGLHQGESTFTGLIKPIPTPFYAICLAIPCLLWIACAVHGLTKGFSREARIFRLPPLAVVIALGCHLIFIRAFEPPQPPPNAIVKEVLAHAFTTPLDTPDGLFPLNPTFYADALGQVAPPFFTDGKRLTRWNAIVSSNCTSPHETCPIMVEPGTLLVCVSPDQSEASLQAVVLSREVVGSAALLSWKKKPLTVPLSLQKKRGTSAQSAPQVPPVPSPAVESKTAQDEPAVATVSDGSNGDESAQDASETGADAPEKAQEQPAQKSVEETADAT